MSSTPSIQKNLVVKCEGFIYHNIYGGFFFFFLSSDWGLSPTEGEMTPIGVTKDLYMLTLKYGEVFLQ